MLSVLIKRKKYELILNEGIPSNLGYYILALFLSFSILATGIAYFSFHAFYLKPIIYIFCFLIPVSYTHLDVYKRQGKD